MTEKQWLKCLDPDKMLRFLSRSKTSDRKLRLFACACCRRIWDRIIARCSRRAVEISERYADGKAGYPELEEAFRAADLAHSYPPLSLERSQALFALDAARMAAHPEMRGLAQATASAALMEEITLENFDEDFPRVRSQQCILLRDLLGNPFCAVFISSSALSWNDGIIPRLAQAAYDDRILPAGTLDNTRLFILADALEEADCTDEQILMHLRGGGEHYRGCWVIDLLLGKQ